MISLEIWIEAEHKHVLDLFHPKRYLSQNSLLFGMDSSAGDVFFLVDSSILGRKSPLLLILETLFFLMQLSPRLSLLAVATFLQLFMELLDLRIFLALLISFLQPERYYCVFVIYNAKYSIHFFKLMCFNNVEKAEGFLYQKGDR